MQIKFEGEGLGMLEDALKVFSKRAIPFATKATINSVAFKIREVAQDDIRRNLTNRNKFTANSVRVSMAKSNVVAEQEAFVGSVAPYMHTQEKGGQKAAQGREGVTIATGYSSGEEGGRPRTRLPRRANRMKNIKLASGRKGANRRQQNAIAVRMAAQSKDKHVFLDLGNQKKGIFKIEGTGVDDDEIKVKMVHDMSRKSVTIPKREWLKPATDAVGPHVSNIYEKALRFQLKRLRILR